MAITITTPVRLPNLQAPLGTMLNDGVNYGLISNPDRLLDNATGNISSFVTGTPKGILLYNCFNTAEIPNNAIIKGIEIVASTAVFNDVEVGAYIGSDDSSDGSFDVKCYLFNGQYSSPLEWDFSDTSISSIDGGNGAEFNGPNKQYKSSNLEVERLFGSPTSLSGLTWTNIQLQGLWGFAISFQNESDNMLGVITRGIGLRATYTIPVKPKLTINTGTKAKLTPKTTTITETRTATAQTTAGTAFTVADVLLGTNTSDFPVPPANYANLGINRTTGDNIELNDFGFNIPSNATIDSLKLIYNLDRNDTSGNDDDFKLKFFLEQNITAQTFPFDTPIHNSNTNFATQEISITNSTILQPNFINNIAWIINWPTDSVYWDYNSTGDVSLSGYNSRPASDLSETALTESILEKPRIQVTYSTTVEGKLKLTEVS